MGIIILGLFFVLFGFDLYGPPKMLLPDSAILEPVLKSPEGKAFVQKYPNYTSNVMQDFYMQRCCQVNLQYIAHIKNLTDSDGNEPAAMLTAYVSVSKDLKKRTVDDDIRFSCIINTEGWTVRGSIVENLRAEKHNCWETPPSVPANQELIDIARNTTVGKKYLAVQPENNIAVNYEGVISVGWYVVFTPKVGDGSIAYAVKVAGLDREIVDTYIRCASGEYRYPTDPHFSSYFEPDNDCLRLANT